MSKISIRIARVGTVLAVALSALLQLPLPNASAQTRRSADVAVTLSTEPRSVVDGDPIHYAAVVSNSGPDTATNVRLTGDMSIALASFLSPEFGCKHDTFNAFSCSLGDIPVGGSLVVRYASAETALAETDGTVRASATAIAAEPDGVRNNHASITTDVQPRRADLHVGLVGDQDPVAGDEVLYVAVVVNDGPDRVVDVTLAGWTNAPITAVHSDIATCFTDPPQFGGFRCDVDELEVADVVVVDLWVESGLPGTELHVGVEASSPAEDPDPRNNRAEQTTTVRPPTADLAIFLGDSVDPIAVGRPITYTATVRNDGPDIADDVRVTGQVIDLLPFEPGDECTANPADVVDFSCTLGPLAPGELAIVTFTVLPEAPGERTASVTVDAREADFNRLNNTAVETTQVRLGLADLEVTITDVDPVTVGDVAVWTAVVTNLGPDLAPDIRFYGQLSGSGFAGLDAIEPSQGSCVRLQVAESHCELGAIQPGASATVLLKAPTQHAPSAVTASVRVDPTGDQDPRANNLASESTAIETSEFGGGSGDAPTTELAINPRNWDQGTAWEAGTAYYSNKPYYFGGPWFSWVQGKGVGKFVYHFWLPSDFDPGANGYMHVRAMMTSTEWLQWPAIDHEWSDVYLYINGEIQGWVRVPSLTELPGASAWPDLPLDSLVAGENVIEFRVGEGEFDRGLTFHYEGLAYDPTAPIRVSIFAD